jgi:hypothetical protein
VIRVLAGSCGLAIRNASCIHTTPANTMSKALAAGPAYFDFFPPGERTGRSPCSHGQIPATGHAKANWLALPQPAG